MPANNTGTIEVGVEVHDLAAYDYSKQDSAALLTSIPVTTGTTLTLPFADTLLETYEFFDVDGSCSGTHPVVVEGTDGQEIQGGSVTFTTPFAWARFRWAGTGWAVESGSGTSEPALAETQTKVKPGTTALTGAFASVLPSVFTFTVAANQKIIVMASGNVESTAGGTGVVRVLLDGATTVGGVTPSQILAASSNAMWSIDVETAALAAGVHTLDVQMELSTGTDATALQVSAVAMRVSV